MIDKLIDEDSGVDDVEVSIPDLGIISSGTSTSGPSTTPSPGDISSYPQFGFNISLVDPNSGTSTGKI